MGGSGVAGGDWSPALPRNDSLDEIDCLTYHVLVLTKPAEHTARLLAEVLHERTSRRLHVRYALHVFDEEVVHLLGLLHIEIAEVKALALQGGFAGRLNHGKLFPYPLIFFLSPKHLVNSGPYLQNEKEGGTQASGMPRPQSQRETNRCIRGNRTVREQNRC